MKAIGGAERQRLLDVVRFLERGVASVGDLDELLDELRLLYGGAAIAITQTPDFVGPGRSHGVPAEWPRIHSTHWHEDPSPRFLAENAPGATFTLDSELSPEQHELALYRAYRGLGFGDGMITKVYSPFCDSLFLVLYREGGAPKIGTDERLLVRLLQPHLAGAFAAKHALAHFESEDVGSPAPSPKVPILGSVAISFPAEDVHWPGGMKTFLGRRLGALERERLERMILAAAKRFDAWKMTGRSQLFAPGIRIEFAAVGPHSGERRRLVAFFLRDGGTVTSTRSPMEELLSPRQRQVARAAARGASTKEIALELRMGVETVRWHLKAVFEKLGVTRRSELARLLSS